MLVYKCLPTFQTTKDSCLSNSGMLLSQSKKPLKNRWERGTPRQKLEQRPGDG